MEEAGSFLRAAIWDNEVEILKELINSHSEDKHREIVNMEDQNGNTPLIIASQNGYKEIVQYLLGAGANVNGVNAKLGTVPLGYAIMFEEAGTAQHDSIVHTLLDAGANVNAVTNGGGTPLMAAAEKGNDNIVRLLISAGADVNATTTEGESPLTIATEKGNDNIVRILAKEIGKNKKTTEIGKNKKTTAEELGIQIAAESVQGGDTVFKVEAEPVPVSTWDLAKQKLGFAGGKRKSKRKKTKRKKTKRKKSKKKKTKRKR